MLLIKINYDAIGKRIKSKRLLNQMTQDKLAEKSGLSNPHICNLENGNTTISLKSLLLIANALETSPDSLLLDNINTTEKPFENDLLLEVNDCSELEITIITDVIKTLKKSLRDKMEILV